MKLNFRGIESGVSTTHGVAPHPIPATLSETHSLNANSTGNVQATQRPVRLLGSDDVTGLEHVPLRSSQRFYHAPTGRWCFYLIGVVCILSLPFALPIAISRAVQIVDGSGKWISAHYTRRVSPEEHPENATLHQQEQSGMGIGAAEPVSFSNELSGRTSAVNIAPPANTRIDSRQFVADSRPVSAPQQSNVRGQRPPASSSDRLQPNYKSTQQHGDAGHPSSDGLAPTEPSSGQTSDSTNYRYSSMRSRKDWSTFSFVRNGHLYMSETFEARLNHMAAHQIVHRRPEIFGKQTFNCSGTPVVYFSFKSSPRLEAELEISTLCGISGNSCTLRPHVDDIRRLHISVAEGKSQLHYITADASKRSPKVSWGPLMGPLQVRILEHSVLALRKTCIADSTSFVRYITVDAVKKILESDEDGDRNYHPHGHHHIVDHGKLEFDVFRYNAFPHEHIREWDNIQNSHGGGNEVGERFSKQTGSVSPSIERRMIENQIEGERGSTLQQNHQHNRTEAKESTPRAEPSQSLQLEKERFFDKGKAPLPQPHQDSSPRAILQRYAGSTNEDLPPKYRTQPESSWHRHIREGIEIERGNGPIVTSFTESEAGS